MKRPASVAPEIPGLEFVRLLGTGGFSDVFLYDQLLPRRPVAVKVLLTDGLNTAARAAFVSEANLMAQLSAHPYIVTIFHADVSTDGRPYFMMEYCSGPSLGELYKRNRFATADALRAGVRLSSAVATAHAAGILHRDIKPANVLTNDFGWPALTDFGISSAVEDELPGHTSTGARDEAAGDSATGEQTVGMSVPWSPPEMFGDNPRPDVRSDVFSLAATLHTLLAGRTPFEIPGRANGALNLIGRIERGAITPIGRDDVPASLVAVLEKGMATRRSERYATAVEFARALQRVELELGYSPTPIEVPTVHTPAAPDDSLDATLVRDTQLRASRTGGTPVDAADGSSDETQVRPGRTRAASPPAPAATPVRSFVPSFIAPAWPGTLGDGTVGAEAVADGTVVRTGASNPQYGRILPSPGQQLRDEAKAVARAEAARAAEEAEIARERAEVVRRRWSVVGVVVLVVVLLAGIAAVIAVGSGALGSTAGRSPHAGNTVSATATSVAESALPGGLVSAVVHDAGAAASGILPTFGGTA